MREQTPRHRQDWLGVQEEVEVIKVEESGKEREIETPAPTRATTPTRRPTHHLLKEEIPSREELGTLPSSRAWSREDIVRINSQ